jgi:single-stranded-DNA-specific exonuclease
MLSKTLPTTQWKIADIKKDLQEQLACDLGVHPIVSGILISRDILTADDAKRYLTPSLTDLHSPFLMMDMRKAVDRVARALYHHEKIMIYGDYDADGITSVAVLMKFLQNISPHVDYYIPDRISEGYGLNIKAIDKIKKSGAQLIITIDCGISDHEEVAYARSIGMDAIILDHHEGPAIIPDAVAVVNPHRADCLFPFKDLAAVGIAFNFLIALRAALRRANFWKVDAYPNLREYLDLVAIGTIGDISPLIDENRIFAKIGLELITENRRPGLIALKEIAGVENQVIDTGKASFCLIPRINAAGRIGSPTNAVKLLLTENRDEARDLAKKLDNYNRKRQTMERLILSEIIYIIDHSLNEAKDVALIFASPKWHPGVIGIVASRLVDRYSRPAILISLKDGIGKGSGRSIGGFNIYEGLKKCDTMLLSYGGHRYAAGISIKEKDIQAFRNLFDDVISQDPAVTDFVSQTFIDSHCQLVDINHDFVSQLETLAPFGSKNPEPVFCARNVNITAPAIVGNNHLRMRVNAGEVSCNSIWFSRGDLIDILTGPQLDIAFTPQINNWNGSSAIQLKLRDIAIQTPSA